VFISGGGGGGKRLLPENTETGEKAARRSRGLRGAPLAPPVGSGTSPSNWESGDKTSGIIFCNLECS
jgi:hypothetical protein